jgi:hypothetical protein
MFIEIKYVKTFCFISTILAHRDVFRQIRTKNVVRSGGMCVAAFSLKLVCGEVVKNVHRLGLNTMQQSDVKCVLYDVKHNLVLGGRIIY